MKKINIMQELAEAQLTGFLECAKGYSITDLVNSMGLKYEEWEKIKKDGMIKLSKDLEEDIDKYYEK